MATPLHLNALPQCTAAHSHTTPEKRSLSVGACTSKPLPPFSPVHRFLLALPKTQTSDGQSSSLSYFITCKLWWCSFFSSVVGLMLSQDMCKPVLYLMWLHPLHSMHSTDDENKNKGERSIQLLPSAGPSLWITALCLSRHSFDHSSACWSDRETPPAWNTAHSLCIRRRCPFFSGCHLHIIREIYSWYLHVCLNLSNPSTISCLTQVAKT